jgi:hypothetical protein
MQESGYLHDAETRELLEKKMKKHEQPEVPTKEQRHAFHNQLRKRMQRRSKFSTRKP